MEDSLGAWKNGTTLPRRIADSDDEIEIVIDVLVHVVRCVAGDVDSHFAHHADRHWMHTLGVGARADDLNVIPPRLRRPAVGYPGTRPVASADYQDTEG